jgi:pyroglutamyl-peptidase
MKTLLLTGFGPFAEHEENPTEALVKNLDEKEINNYKIVSAILPVEYQSSITQLSDLIETHNPDALISIGLAADRSEITPELIAINYQHSKTPDKAKVIKKFQKINSKGKESFYSTLPIEQMILALEKNNIPTKLSSAAGTYVCNTVMYHGLKTIQQTKRNCPSGFIHIPNNMEQEKLVQAITICINTL